VATLREANLAREEHSERLRAMGAHAVMVDQVPGSAGTGYAVYASFERPPARPPKTLEVKVAGKPVQVPLIAQKAERFRPE
jgi:hypothetical protein